MNGHSSQVNGAAPGMFLVGYEKCITFPAWEAELFISAAPVSPALGSDWERGASILQPLFSVVHRAGKSADAILFPAHGEAN